MSKKFILVNLVFLFSFFLLPANATEYDSSARQVDVPQADSGAQPGDYFIASLEEIIINMGGEVVYNLFANKPTGMNFERIWKSICNPYIFDSSPFLRNQLVHPLAGSLFFTAARSNNLDFWTSFAYTAVSSWMMENLFQYSYTSINDLITTTMAGCITGEVLHRLGYVVFDLWNPLLWFVSPVDAANDVLRNRWGKSFQSRGGSKVDMYKTEFFLGGGFSYTLLSSNGGSANNSATDATATATSASSAASATSATDANSASRSSIHASSAAQNGFSGFGSFGAYLVYGEPFDHKTKQPFDQFSMDIQLFTDFGGVSGFMAIEGQLYSWPFFQNTRLPSSIGISLNYKVNLLEELSYSTNALGFFLCQKIPLNFSESGYFSWNFETNFIFLEASRISETNYYNFGPEAKIQFDLETSVLSARLFSEFDYVFFQRIYHSKTFFSLDFKIIKYFSIGISDLFFCINGSDFFNFCGINFKAVI